MRVIPAASLEISAFVRPGDRIVVGQATGEPQTLTEALVAQRARVGPVGLFLGSCFSRSFAPEHSDHIRFSGFGAVGTVRKLAAGGAIDVVPCHVSQVASYIEGGLIGCDVAFVQLSPAGSDGRHSFGVINDYVQAAIASARIVVAEINDQVPQSFGDVGLSPQQIDFAVYSSRPVVELPSVTIGALEQTIAGHVSKFIEDGSTLQVGVGAIPDAILHAITDRRDLGVHSGSIGDGLVALMERGIVTNARKPIDAGVSVTGALMGTRRLYDFANCNPAIALRASRYTHDATVLAQIPNLVAINSAVEVDLTGQVNAEVAAGAYIGATGGQGDFQRAAHRAPRGHAIVALPSMAGASSRVVSRLSGPVTVARHDADIVVTEYGSAQLKGCPLAERARRMIAIAHPDWRDTLAADAKALGLLT